MKALIQRVLNAAVTVNGKTVGKCGNGLLVLFCAVTGDTDEDAALLAKKTAALRIFCDENGKLNKSVTTILPTSPFSAFSSESNFNISI